MKSGISNKVLMAILLMAIIPILLSAGTTGKIKGTVTDKETGKPIPGAAIQIVGTTLGAMTDAEGKFVIPLIPAGIQELKITCIGYRLVEITAIRVIEDISTEVLIEMEKSVTDLGHSIKVIANRDVISHYNTSRSIEMSRQEAKSDKKQNNNICNITIPKPIAKPEPSLYSLNLPRIISKDEYDEESDHKFGDDPIYGRKRPGETPRTITRGGCIPPPPPYNPPYPPYPWHGGSAIVNGEPYDAMFFKDYGTNPFIDTEDDHLSTFAIDIDDASFNMARSYLDKGHLPPDEAIRVEEFVNHFKYNYDSPRGRPFNVNAEGGPSIFGDNCQLLKIGIQGRILNEEERKPANLVFVIDVSGSMSGGNRLGLVKRTLKTLVNHLEEDDKVGIIVYGSHGRVVLEMTSIWHEERILDAINRLYPGGSTNAEEGLRLGYKMADRNFDRRKINRIILCSDGVANVGQTSPDELLRWIKGYADRGISLTTVGFGMGNYNDILMEKLANKGNGLYAYVDDFEEARKVFLDNLTGMLQMIAKDVKIQVDFNREVVRSYRLLGYENRDVADNKFRDDKEDGGEIGSGHQVTALYEVKLRKRRSSNHIATVFVRYKDPESSRANEIAGKIFISDFQKKFKNCSSDFKLAACAAEFAEILGKSYWARNSDIPKVLGIAKRIRRVSDNRDVEEFIELVKRSDRLIEERAER